MSFCIKLAFLGRMCPPEEYPPILVENLTKVFPGKRKKPDKKAVDGISFQVKRGEIFGLLGPNGAGKTTTIRMLSTMLIPTDGRALILGNDVTKDEVHIRKRINLVSGGERGLYYRLTGRQNLRFFSELYGIDPKTRDERIDRLLDLVDLQTAADIRVEDYSRGMKQRIHIARALVNDPEVLFLDEPTLGLDPEIARDIRALIRRMADQGTTILLTTHYMFEAEELCDRIAIISNGRLVAQGNALELKDSVNNATVIHVETRDDPFEAVALLEGSDGVIHVNCDRVPGRFITRIQVEQSSDMLDTVNEAVKGLRVLRIGYDEPTLEDTYITLVSGHER